MKNDNDINDIKIWIMNPLIILKKKLLKLL